MKLIKFGFPFLGLMLSSFAAHADMAQGKRLQEQSCTACHNNSVYTRPNRRITSLAGLQKQVGGCTRPAGVKWNQQQIKNVVEYLNKEFYHFK